MLQLSLKVRHEPVSSLGGMLLYNPPPLSKNRGVLLNMLSIAYFPSDFQNVETYLLERTSVSYKKYKFPAKVINLQLRGSPSNAADQRLETLRTMSAVFKIKLEYCYCTSKYEVHMIPNRKMITINDFSQAMYPSCKVRCMASQRVLSPDNVNQVLEFATNYGYDELKAGCYEQLKSTYNPSMGDSSRLLSDLGTEWRTELLNTASVEMKRLSFQDSWRHPEAPLPTADLLAMMQSSSCQEQGLKYFSGCVAGEVVAHIPWAPQRECEVPVMCLSLCSSQQTNEVFSALDVNKFTGQLSIHLICNKVPPEGLAPLPATRLADLPDLYISDANDQSIPWIVSIVKTVMPPDQGYSFIKFPRCQITPNGCKNMLSCLASAQVKLRGLRMSSPHLPPLFRAELRRWINTNISDPIGITPYESHDNMDGW
ncbi:unnamed protein product [Meganyctiphanes norvegica]|uniref:Uncharacterized protein n=1 Tax=Meganyctiphanes norvegica TaxID=48144 RepID=A0AAV2QQD5_MEGNR